MSKLQQGSERGTTGAGLGGGQRQRKMKNLESLRSLFQSYYRHLIQRVFECLEGGATMKLNE